MMSQRQSLSLNLAIPVANNFAAAVKMAKFMLESKSAETPFIFLDHQAIREAAAEAAQATEEKATPAEEGSNFETFTIMCMNEPTACVITFTATGNSLCIVGSSQRYYFVDVANNIFFETDAPQYDVEKYVADYGNSEVCDFHFVHEEHEPTPPAASSVVVQQEQEQQHPPPPPPVSTQKTKKQKK